MIQEAKQLKRDALKFRKDIEAREEKAREEAKDEGYI